MDELWKKVWKESFYKLGKQLRHIYLKLPNTHLHRVPAVFVEFEKCFWQKISVLFDFWAFVERASVFYLFFSLSTKHTGTQIPNEAHRQSHSLETISYLWAVNPILALCTGKGFYWLSKSQTEGDKALKSQFTPSEMNMHLGLFCVLSLWSTSQQWSKCTCVIVVSNKIFDGNSQWHSQHYY